MKRRDFLKLLPAAPVVAPAVVAELAKPKPRWASCYYTTTPLEREVFRKSFERSLTRAFAGLYRPSVLAKRIAARS